jgi:peptide/nickel transport system substrate-binding protein
VAAVSPAARLSRRAVLAGAGAALTGLALARTGARPARAESGARDLVVAQGADVARLDPHFSTDIWALFNLYDTLVTRRADRQLHPALAVRWTLVRPTAWEFQLRPGVRFHTGEPFTATDVKYSLERAADRQARTLVASVFTTLDRVEVVDPLLVRLHTRAPDPLLPARLAGYGGQMLSRAYVEAVGTDGMEAHPVGTGPLRLVERVRGDRLVLAAVPDYWGGAVDVERVVFRTIPEPASRVAALLRGEVDLIGALAPDHADRVAQDPGTKVAETLLAGVYVLAVNSRHPPLDNPLVKQALSLALDRAAIVKELWRGHGLVSNGPIPQGDRFHDDARPALACDPEAARRRLAAAGYRGDEIVLESTTGYMINDRPMAEAAVAMWRDVGINARLELVEYSVLAQKVRERSFKGLRWAVPISTLGDPDGLMWRLLAPGGAHDLWRHARFDELGQAARVSVDERFRREAYREMTDIFLEHLPWIPVLQPADLYGLRRTVEWTPYPTAHLDLRRFNLRVRRG